MRYFGSKVSTVENVYRLIEEKIPHGTVCDPFGGIGTVGSFFKSCGYSVWTGDILTFAFYFQIARVLLNRAPAFVKLLRALNKKKSTAIIDLLNDAKCRNGWFIDEYALKRHFFTVENARRIEACRKRIYEWDAAGLLNGNERAVLLSSLINSVDRVANTAGTYYAYLKTWHRKALRPFSFSLLPCTRGNSKNHCLLGDARDLVGQRAFDILYLDPPYNERSYGHYYHLPETIARGECPTVHGKSGMPNSTKTISAFNSPSKVREALKELLQKARFKLLAFHYQDDGLISKQELRRIFTGYGDVSEFILNSKGYTTTNSMRVVKHRLYLVTHG